MLVRLAMKAYRRNHRHYIVAMHETIGALPEPLIITGRESRVAGARHSVGVDRLNVADVLTAEFIGEADSQRAAETVACDENLEAVEWRGDLLSKKILEVRHDGTGRVAVAGRDASR